MGRRRWVVMGLGIVIFYASKCLIGAEVVTVNSPRVSEILHIEASESPNTASGLEQNHSGIQVNLTAAHKTESWDTRLEHPQHFALPVLYLHRERTGAMAGDRTLNVDIAGLEGGTEIEIELVSWHVNVTTGEHHHETLRVFLPDGPCKVNNMCSLQWTLEPEGMLSDLYTFRVRDRLGKLVWENADQERPDLAILDTWDVPIEPHTVRITYAMLFPFDHGQNYRPYRLAPDAVTDFIEQSFVPIIVDTWHTQFDAWGFGPIHPDWDPDKVVEIYVTVPPFALFNGTGTYTTFEYQDGTTYPERRLWWYSSNNSFLPYGLLEDGYKVVFAHEFFHMVQWNVLLSAGCSTQRWRNTFIEAQGKFVPSVQYPEIEILTGHSNMLPSLYGSTAKGFLEERLNTSYQDLEQNPDERYDLALYWRFVYEQFGDMGILRTALEEMACQYNPDIVKTIGSVMDATLARFEGPFDSYEESLIAYSRANFALHLEGGRCETPDLRGCGGRYYDPDGIYPDPPLKAVLEFTGDRLTYVDSIPASFGMDFVEVNVDRELSGQVLNIALRSDGARLNVEIWELGKGLWEQPRPMTPVPESIPEREDGIHTFSIPHIDLTKHLKFALIITRLDSKEKVNPSGSYTLTLEGASSIENGYNNRGDL